MNEKTSQKQTLKRQLSNNLFIVKLAMTTVPDIYIMNIIKNIVLAVLNFAESIWLIQFMLNGIQMGYSFRQMLNGLMIFVAAHLGWHVLYQLYTQVILPKRQLTLEKHVYDMIFKKMRNADIECFEQPEFYDKYVVASSELISRMDSVFNSLNNVIYLIIHLCLTIYTIVAIDPWLILFTFIPAIIYFVTNKKSNSINHKYNIALHKEHRQRDYTHRTFYLADYAKEMRMTGISNVMLERFNRSVENIIALVKKYGAKLAIIYTIRDCTNDLIGKCPIMLYAVYKTIIKGTMLVGDSMVLINSVNNVVYTLAEGVAAIMSFHENSLYIDNIRDFLEYEPKIKGGELAAPRSGDIELKNVSFTYSGSNNAVLSDINMRINSSQKIALVGHNGAGKSTLIKLILRLYDPQNGKILYCSNNIKDYELNGKASYRDNFSVVFQDLKLFAMSIQENVLLDNAKDDKRVWDALDAAGISDKIRGFDNSINTQLTREFYDDGELLSGGEAQKIAIARAFARDAGIVILDEPSSALDPIAEYKMYESMMNVCKGKSVIIISHRLSSAVLADNIYMLENGKVVETGTHDALMKQNGKYAEMFNIQAQNYIQERQANYED